MNKLILLGVLLIFLVPVSLMAQKQFTLSAPLGKLEVEISVSDKIEYLVKHGGDMMLYKSPISMTLVDGKTFGVKPKLSGTSKRTVDETISASVYKKSKIKDNFNELTLKFKDFDIIFRAYDLSFCIETNKRFSSKGRGSDFQLS